MNTWKLYLEINKLLYYTHERFENKFSTNVKYTQSRPYYIKSYFWYFVIFLEFIIVEEEEEEEDMIY